MLSDARRSAQTLQRSLLVLHQRTHHPGKRRGMQRTRWPVLLVQRRSTPALRTIVLVLHQRPGRPGSGGRLPRERRSVLRLARRSGQKLSRTNSDSAAKQNADTAHHLYSGRTSTNSDSSNPEIADAVAQTWRPESDSTENLHRKTNGDADSNNA